MKLINESVTVRCTGERPIAGQSEPQPQTVFWKGRQYYIKTITATWRWRGAWWTTPLLAGHQRTYYRVMCAPPGAGESSSASNRGLCRELCMELYNEEGRWTLSRLLD